MLPQYVVAGEATLWPRKSQDRNKKNKLDVFFGIWVSLRNQLLQQLERELHLKG
jgi:hypothetical protein